MFDSDYRSLARMDQRLDKIILLRTVAPQQSATVTTLQRALRDGMSPAALLAVADWNERKGYDERRRNSRKRLKNQAVALRVVAGELEAGAWTRGQFGMLEAA